MSLKTEEKSRLSSEKRDGLIDHRTNHRGQRDRQTDEGSKTSNTEVKQSMEQEKRIQKDREHGFEHIKRKQGNGLTGSKKYHQSNKVKKQNRFIICSGMGARA